MADAGSGLELEFKDKFTDQTLTSVAPDDPWYRTINPYRYR